MPDLAIYGKCNNKCLMCTNPAGYQLRQKEFNKDQMSRRIDAFFNGEKVFFNNYRDSFSLTGGEPTLSPYLFDLIKKIRKNHVGMEIALLTNGRRLADLAFTKKVLSSHDHLTIIVPVHGPTAALHDRITRVKGSFDQTMRGIKNLLSLKRGSQQIEIRVVLHQMNYTGMVDIFNFLSSEFKGITRQVYVFHEIEGGARRHLKDLKLKYAQLYPIFEKFPRFPVAGMDIRFYHFPLCVIPPRFWPFVWRTLPVDEVFFPRQCGRCLVKEYCVGPHKGYVESVGGGDFKPVSSRMRMELTGFYHYPIRGVFL